MSAPSNRAQYSRASRKSAPCKLAPARSAYLRLASLRLAWLKSAALRSAAARLASLKSSPASLAFLRFSLLRSALLKSAPLRSAPARLTSPRLASLRSTPFSSIAVPGCSSLHMFQAVATSCFNRSNCCSFAIVNSFPPFSASQKQLCQVCLEVIWEGLERRVPLHSSPTPPTRFSRLCQYVSRSRPKTPLQRRGASLLCHDWLLRPQSAVPAHARALQVHAHRRERDEGDGRPHPRCPRPLLA